MAKQIETLPPCDILLSHNCPADIGHERPGESAKEYPEGVHQGFTAINAYIAREKPKLIFHGHQHIKKTTKLEETTVIGCYGETLHKITLP